MILIIYQILVFNTVKYLRMERTVGDFITKHIIY